MTTSLAPRLLTRWCQLAIFILVAVGGLHPTTALTQFLIINDCNGFTRAVEQVGDKARNIELDVSSAQGNVSSARVSLTNDVTGEVHYAAAKGGKVTFGNVMPGIYTVGTGETNLIIGAIKFSPLPILGTAGSTIVGALVVGGGATAGIIGVDAIVDATEGDPGDSPPPPTPTPEPLPDDCAVCDPDASPPPLDEDDFSDLPTDTARLSPAS